VCIRIIHFTGDLLKIWSFPHFFVPFLTKTFLCLINLLLDHRSRQDAMPFVLSFKLLVLSDNKRKELPD
jgi:hypothetical protein